MLLIFIMKMILIIEQRVQWFLITNIKDGQNNYRSFQELNSNLFRFNISFNVVFGQ